MLLCWCDVPQSRVQLKSLSLWLENGAYPIINLIQAKLCPLSISQRLTVNSCWNSGSSPTNASSGSPAAISSTWFNIRCRYKSALLQNSSAQLQHVYRRQGVLFLFQDVQVLTWWTLCSSRLLFCYKPGMNKAIRNLGHCTTVRGSSHLHFSWKSDDIYGRLCLISFGAM